MNAFLLLSAPVCYRRLVSVLLGLLLPAGSLLAGKNDAIAICSTAAPGYVRPLDEKGKPVPETYVFMEGIHLEGGTRDRSEERMTYEEITRTLAVNLARQNYFPTRDVSAAQALIRVYWGTTQIYEDPQRDQNLAALNSAMANAQSQMESGGQVDTTELKQAINDNALAADGVEGAIERNARLLGYKRSLLKEEKNMMASVAEQTMRMELSEERYFVVLMAYDFQFMKREKKPKLLWVTRLSIRTPGNNFTEALPALAVAGAEVYGRNLDGLERIKVRDLPGGEVILGDLKVIGVEEKPVEKKAEK
ncbi:hypothetical protein ESB00_11745 [Oleiharenicola lentus]|uniref:Uncharacterized protein n=1 Tax=Oleiharenicola lentus TaxID=2508720 RepID=A0A4Q1CBN8_9BACT|nr:hypothetical protein [Oleiharenicola lentus]RXK56504.1 hypothetical protein ESB00_11745 [Oleiharenicola lentus]